MRHHAPGPCAAGAFACEAGALVCIASAAEPEVCNGADDDCDGEVDNGDPGGGASCDTGLLGVCAAGTVHCQAGGLGCVPGAQPSEEVCSGQDDDCDGLVDEPPVSCLRRVFVTSQGFLGNLGGLDGADAACQGLASAAGLIGTYKAWLSSSTVDARDRLTHVGKPYVLVDGTLVADDWADLTDGYLHHAIDLSEQLGPPPPFPKGGTDIPVITATNPDGTLHFSSGLTPKTCGDWTQATGYSHHGFAALLAPSWTTGGAGPNCDVEQPLYCFEQ